MEMILISITVSSVLLAAAMSFVTWRLWREERRRSEARIAALAADIQDAPSRGAPDLTLRDQPAPPPIGELFAPAHYPNSRSRWGFAAASGAAVAIAAAALVAASGGARQWIASAEQAGPALPPAAPAALELVSLTHVREADRLTVRGTVRNPAQTPAVRGLVAVVLLFDTEGGFVASARAPVDAPSLEPGREAGFAVSVPADDVGRYRVSFRTGDRVLPHVDARQL